MKQVIVVNKALKMKKGKMSAQVGHGSIAFLTEIIRNSRLEEIDNNLIGGMIYLDKEVFEQWINGQFKKIVVYAQNEEEMNEIVAKAQSKGLVERKDYFNIIDSGYTVFNGNPTWTVIGFRPMKDEEIDDITRDLQLAS